MHLLLLSLAALADETPSARVAGLGGASIADPTDTTSIRTNPAALALLERYDLQGAFLYGPTKDMRWSAGVIDSQTSEWLGFGVSYAGGRTTSTPFAPEDLPPFVVAGEDPVNAVSRHDITLGASVPLLDRRLAFGLGGTLSILERPWQGKEVTGNATLGVAARPADWITLGLAARDVLPIKGQYDRPASMAFGVRGGDEERVFGAVEIEGRLEHNDTATTSPITARVGVEGVVRFVHGRAGYAFEGPLDRHSLSLGLGVGNSAGSLDYTMVVPLNASGLGAAGLQHVLSLTLRTNAMRRDDVQEDLFPAERGGGSSRRR